jgi:hypothetical protein
MTTKTDDEPTESLTPQQAAAADLLAGGANVSEAAESLGVARQTVSGWLNNDFIFRAEVNKRRNELWKARTNRLLKLVPKALDTIDRELDGERALFTAIHVLKATGLYGISIPNWSTEDPKDIEAQARRSKQIDDLIKKM